MKRIFFYIVGLLVFSTFLCEGAGLVAWKQHTFHEDSLAHVSTYSRKRFNGNEGIFHINGKDIYLPGGRYWFIEIPNTLPLELVDSWQYEDLLRQRHEMRVFRDRFPKSSAILDPWLKRLQEYQDNYDSGKRFVNGVWMEKSTYEQQQAAQREKRNQRRLQEEQKRKEAELRMKKSNSQIVKKTKIINKNKREKNEFISFDSLSINRNGYVFEIEFPVRDGLKLPYYYFDSHPDDDLDLRIVSGKETFKDRTKDDEYSSYIRFTHNPPEKKLNNKLSEHTFNWRSTLINVSQCLGTILGNHNSQRRRAYAVVATLFGVSLEGLNDDKEEEGVNAQNYYGPMYFLFKKINESLVVMDPSRDGSVEDEYAFRDLYDFFPQAIYRYITTAGKQQESDSKISGFPQGKLIWEFGPTRYEFFYSIKIQGENSIPNALVVTLDLSPMSNNLRERQPSKKQKIYLQAQEAEKFGNYDLALKKYRSISNGFGIERMKYLIKQEKDNQERLVQLKAREEAEKHRRELQISRDKEDEHLKIAFTVSSEERENLEKRFEERDKKRDTLTGERVKQILRAKYIIQKLRESGNIAIDAKNNKIPEKLLFKTFIKAAAVMGVRSVDGTRAIEDARKSGFDMNELDLKHTLIYLCEARLAAIKEYPCIMLFHHARRVGLIDHNKTPEIWKMRSIITDPEQGMDARRKASDFLDNRLTELLGGGSYLDWVEEAKQTMTEASAEAMADDFDSIGNYKAYTYIEDNLEKGMTALKATDQEIKMLKKLYLELGDYALMALLDSSNKSLNDLYEDIRLSELAREKREKYLNFDYVRIVRRYRPAVTSAIESKDGRAFLSRLQWMMKDVAEFQIHVGEPIQSEDLHQIRRLFNQP